MQIDCTGLTFVNEVSTDLEVENELNWAKYIVRLMLPFSSYFVSFSICYGFIIEHAQRT